MEEFSVHSCKSSFVVVYECFIFPSSFLFAPVFMLYSALNIVGWFPELVFCTINHHHRELMTAIIFMSGDETYQWNEEATAALQGC